MIAVISKSGKPLMPTNKHGMVRRMLKNGEAEIVKREPVFTIRLNYETTNATQETELCIDSGYKTIGVSVKTEKREVFSAEYKLPEKTSERLTERRKYRRIRRNHLRYRKARFLNRKVKKGWIPPSVDAKIQRHQKLAETLCGIFPVSRITVEVAQFDPAAIKAMLSENIVLSGADYQKGEQYGFADLREYILSRDKHTCKICERGIKDSAILQLHHIGYYKEDRSNRPSNLLTVCEKCHTSANHKKGGKLYGLKPQISTLKEATFMNIARYRLLDALRTAFPEKEVASTYGSITKTKRLEMKLPKTHTNDAYSMGFLYPEHRENTVYFKALRRNNRALELFYDAKYIDNRTGKKRAGSHLSTGRTKRDTSITYENQRIYRGSKISSGRRQIRRKRYKIQPGDKILHCGKWYVSKGTQNKGAYIAAEGKKPIPAKDIEQVRHVNTWQKIC